MSGVGPRTPMILMGTCIYPATNQEPLPLKIFYIHNGEGLWVDAPHFHLLSANLIISSWMIVSPTNKSNIISSHLILVVIPLVWFPLLDRVEEQKVHQLSTPSFISWASSTHLSSQKNKSARDDSWEDLIRFDFNLMSIWFKVMIVDSPAPSSGSVLTLVPSQ